MLLSQFSMVRTICQTVVLLFAASVCLAGVDPAGEQLLTSASDLVNIRAADAKPFQLDIDFGVQLRTQQTGHLTLKWAAKDLWSQQVTMGDYQQLDVRKGETLYISRNASFTPLRITDLFDLLTVFSAEPDHWQVKKIKEQSKNGVAMSCMEIRWHSGNHEWDSKREVCINRATKEVLTDEIRDDQDYKRKEFTDYRSFREHRYPKRSKLLMNGSTVVDVQVVSLQDAAFDDSAFVPPPGARARRQCENITVPVVVKDPDPAYPRSAAQNRLGGTATVALTVLPDGSVTDVQLIGSAGHEMDQVTQEIVRTWKFKPAMCGNEPVAFDVRVEVNFRLER